MFFKKKWLIDLDYSCGKTEWTHDDYLEQIKFYSEMLDGMIEFKEIASQYPQQLHKIDKQINDCRDKIAETRAFLFERDGFI